MSLVYAFSKQEVGLPMLESRVILRIFFIKMDGH
jgi:hypothetical protein